MTTINAASSQETLSEPKIPDQDMSSYGNSNQDVGRSLSNSNNNLSPNNGNTRPDSSGTEDSQFDELKANQKLPSIFSPRLKKERLGLMKAMIKVELLLAVIVLGILSIYWGGLASVLPNVRVLTVAVVDFDGQEVGNALTQFGIGQFGYCSQIAIQRRQEAEQMNQPTLGYITQSGSLYNNDPAVLRAHLLNEKMWVAISVKIFYLYI
jgi:hypothetical protein